MLTIQRDTTSLYYYDSAKGDTTIVFIPPLGGSTETWKYQTQFFESKGYRVVSFDVRGHGQSSGSDLKTYSMDLFAEDLEHILAHCGVEEAHFIGSSLGGMIAIRYALRNPRHVSKLVLVGTTAEALSQDEKHRASLDLDITIARSSGLAELIRLKDKKQRYFGEHLTEREEREAERYFSGLSKIDVDEYVKLHNAAAMKPDETSAFRDFAVQQPNRVLFVVGEHEKAFPIEHQRNLQVKIPNSDLIIIPDAPHFCFINNPEYFNNMLYEFLQK